MSEWQIKTISGAVAIFHKGLSLSEVLDAFTKDRPDDEIVSVIDLSITQK